MRRTGNQDADDAYEELLERVDRLLDSRGRVVAAISGFGGSGKTTLAGRLREHYAPSGAHVLGLDDFIVDRATGAGVLGGFDWARFTSVLADVKAGRGLDYQPCDFDGQPRGERVVAVLPRLLVVEGVRLIRPELAPYFDLTVWIDLPVELAEARGRERDRLAGVGEEDLALWDLEWTPKERAHFETQRPDLAANLLYRVAP